MSSHHVQSLRNRSSASLKHDGRPSVSTLSSSARTAKGRLATKHWPAMTILVVLAMGAGLIFVLSPKDKSLLFQKHRRRLLWLEKPQYKFSEISGNPKSTTPFHDWNIESGKLAHDDPRHPLHWMRQGSPRLNLRTKRDCNQQSYGDMYNHFHKYGYVIFRSCSLSSQTLSEVRDFTQELKGVKAREQDAWKYNAHVRDLATDQELLAFLEFLHGGRRVFPFQTLNFPVGTEQALHSDLVHFDTLPQRVLMAAAWTALEPITDKNGPLTFFPGSHQHGIWDYPELGIFEAGQAQENMPEDRASEEYAARLYSIYERYLEENLPKNKFLQRHTNAGMKTGETLIWASSLVHGGLPVVDRNSTRLSQVTHYYFDGAGDYWVPRKSDPVADTVFVKGGMPICEKIDPDYNMPNCADRCLSIWRDDEDHKKKRWSRLLI